MKASPSVSSTSNRSRRQVLGWGVAGVSAGVVGYLASQRKGEVTTRTPALPAKTNPAELPPATYAGVFQRDAFIPHLNTEFTIERNADAIAGCKLVDVSPAKVMTTPAGTFVAFSLEFEARTGFLTSGGICTVRHPKMKEMQFALFPIGDRRKKHLLEACFTLRA